MQNLAEAGGTGFWWGAAKWDMGKSFANSAAEQGFGAVIDTPNAIPAVNLAQGLTNA